MEFTIQLSDIIGIIISVGFSFYIIFQLNKLKMSIEIQQIKIDNNTERIFSFNDSVETRVNQKTASALSALKIHSHAKSNPETLKNFNLIEELYENVFSKDLLSLEELQGMKFYLHLNGEIDQSTKSSFVRTLLASQYRKGKLHLVVGWIRENRPDINF